MIKTELRNHLVGYVVLLIGVVVFCNAFFAVWPDRFWERITIGGFAWFYIIWGIGIHKVKNQLTPRVFSEYLFVALIGSLLLLMLTF